MTNINRISALRGRSWRPNQRAVDVLLAVVAAVAGLTNFVVGENNGATGTALSVVVIIGASATLVFRRQHPAAVLIAIAVARLFVTWEAGTEVPLSLAVVIALYTVARYADRRAGLFLAAAVAIVMGVAAAAIGDEVFVHELLGELAQGLLPLAVGDAVRARSDRMQNLIDSEAEARVQAERLRIARDLHDVVAHGLSTIAVQSGVAAHLIDRDPDQARQALEVINSTGKGALEELRAMVGVLRSTDGAELRPMPTNPNDIGTVIAGATKAGVEVSLQSSGEFPVDASDASVVAVHRIVQEALTNVIRHAGGAATFVQIDHADDHVVVEVRNVTVEVRSAGPVEAHRSGASTGVGIVGMQERAESVGGTLVAGPTRDGGFEVVATVPYQLAQP